MRLVLLLATVFYMGCKNNHPVVEKTTVDSQYLSEADTLKGVTRFWKDPLNGNTYPLPDSIAGKAISYYINNPRIILLAKNFYNGLFRPSDNDSTTLLLSKILTADSTTRPFYRWCLDFTIYISDGALAEYPGVAALKYAIKYPTEFFNFMDEDSSGERYKRWTEMIAFSGINSNNNQPNKIEQNISIPMIDNCYSCGIDTKNRILAFAKIIVSKIKINS